MGNEEQVSTSGEVPYVRSQKGPLQVLRNNVLAPFLPLLIPFYMCSQGIVLLGKGEG